MAPSSDVSRRTLSLGMAGLGVLIVAYAVLGPLVLDIIHFRTSASGLNQVRGGDLAALFVVAPACFAVAVLAWRAHPAAPVLALAPGTFAMYTYSQLVLGNEYLARPGNIERFFPLLLALFVLASAVVLHCWGQVRPEDLPVSTRRLRRVSGVLLVVIAAFVALGLHLPGLVGALADPPRGAAYLDLPNTFWVVKLYDLGIVVPAALAVGIGLLRDHAWARKPAYAIVGGYTLLGWSVAGMTWNMLLNADPDASVPMTVGFTGLSIALSGFALVLYRPLFTRSSTPLGAVRRNRIASSTAATGNTPA
ncbi:MAG: hypothetical protein JWP61_2792 [Friedmanniella sp.]|nr:hypothetical protein [Friedmanniella sp.]